MQSDDVIWSVINQQFCSYKVKYVVFLWVSMLFGESEKDIYSFGISLSSSYTRK